MQRTSLLTILAFNFTLALQATESLYESDFVDYFNAAVKACEGLETGDECTMAMPDGERKGACIWDTDIYGDYVNACIVPL